MSSFLERVLSPHIPRALPMVEAMMAIVLADFLLRSERTRQK